MVCKKKINYHFSSDLIINEKCAILPVSYTHLLMSANLPDVDLMVRTSGEQRLSNFMLWQLAYAEFIFTPVCWPDFDEKELHKAIWLYQNRERRYGGLK